MEVASALRRLWLSKVLSEERRDEALLDYVNLTMTRHGHVDLLPRMLELGASMSAYDAVYAALAETLSAALVTADGKLRRGIETHTSVTLV